MPSFSVIIPFKTGKHYLIQCVQSVLLQDHPGFEVIILADNTSNIDGALDSVMELYHPKIRIEAFEGALNILENWDRIRQLKRMEFMTILGYDDLLEPTFLSAIDSLIRKYPDASLYHTHFNYIDSAGRVLRPCQPLPEKLAADEYLCLSLQEKISVMATGYVFRSADYDLAGGIPIKYPNLIYADLQLWIELTKVSYLAVEQGSFFSFRLHSSTTKTSKDRVLLKAFVLYLRYLETLMVERPGFEKAIRKWTPVFIAQTTRSLAHRLLRTARNYRDGLTMQMIFEEIGKEAARMGIAYDPASIPSIKITVWIDRNPVILRLFRFFRRVYNKPFY